MRILLFILLFFITQNNLYAKKLKIILTTNEDHAEIYIDNKIKGQTDHNGNKQITLEEGLYHIKIIKPLNNIWDYESEQDILVKDNHKITPLAFSFLQFKKVLTQNGKSLQALNDEKVLARFQKTSNEVVVDKINKLMWQDDNSTVRLKMNWHEAIQYCNKSTLLKYTNWRLPTYSELLMIVDYNRNTPSLIPLFTAAISEAYWTSSTSLNNNQYAWKINFNNGSSDDYFKSSKNFIRCVRSIKEDE